MEAREKSQPTHSTPVCGKMSNKDRCQARAIHGGQGAQLARKAKLGRWAEVQAKDRESRMLQQRPLSRAGSDGAWSSSQPGEISSAFPIILTQEDGEKKEKSLLETDYITATSQPVTSPSL